ncbi:terminase [Helicobacter cetorum]|uniref:terminase n=1 Tax=Helicobacter cetorum TaxID=138563 RepID=UPI000CF096A3|nr:terminase [Helicobacter cetorum]
MASKKTNNPNKIDGKKEYPESFKEEVREFYENNFHIKQEEISKIFNINRATLARWIIDGEWKNDGILKEIRAMYETHNFNLNELSKRYNISTHILRRAKEREKWKKAVILKNIEEKKVLNNKLTDESIGLFLDTKKQEIKDSLKESLEHLELDPIVLESITETTSDELLLKAMNTAYIKKQILFCAIVARGELIKMIKRASMQGSIKDNASIIVAAEKVSKLFIDAGVSLFGKEQIQVIENTKSNDYKEINTQELLALAHSNSDEL